ncbi:MAG TPA: metallophosphoesterase [Atopostipes sp.]|nr:metallophosphoesterase [Atopostipes sp.]
MSNEKNLTVLQLNDVHGYLDEHFEIFYEADGVNFKKVGGYARIANYLNQAREETNNKVMVLDGGDTFHGTYPVVQTKGKLSIPILNRLGIDGMTGHWDFAYGPDHLDELASKLNYPMLAINCYKKDTEELVFQPYRIKEVNGLKIGIIGIAAMIVDKTMPEQFSKGVSLTSGKEELPKYIREVKENHDVDLVVIMSHLGYPQDMKIAEETDGIDVYLSAHTHNRVYEPAEVNGALLIKSGSHGSFVGRLDLTVEDKKITDYTHALVLMDEAVSEEVEMKELVQEKLEPYQEELSEVIGETKTDLYRNEVLESTMDNFLLQSLLEHTGAEATFSRDPFNQIGGYVKRMLGLKVYAKLENPKGYRLQEVFIGDEPLEKERVYNATFVTVQGVPAKYGKDRKQLDTHAIDALKQYVKKHETVEAPLRGTITLV